jgi:hypothetical protein
MDKKLADEIAAQLQKMAELYRRAADQSVATMNAFDVYLHVKESLSYETKLRAHKNRWLRG